MSAVSILYLNINPKSSPKSSGNLTVLQKRFEWRGINVDLIDTSINEISTIPKKHLEKVNLLVAEGELSGITHLNKQDLKKFQDDLKTLQPSLNQLAEKGIPMLATGGMFPLLGKEINFLNDKKITGLAILEKTITNLLERPITGAYVGKSDHFGDIYGFESHTYEIFLNGDRALSTTQDNNGNNGKDYREGAFYRNIIATNLSGPVLALNPKIADFLIIMALKNRYQQDIELEPLTIDTTLVKKARNETF